MTCNLLVYLSRESLPPFSSGDEERCLEFNLLLQKSIIKDPTTVGRMRSPVLWEELAVRRSSGPCALVIWQESAVMFARHNVEMIL